MGDSEATTDKFSYRFLQLFIFFRNFAPTYDTNNRKRL